MSLGLEFVCINNVSSNCKVVKVTLEELDIEIAKVSVGNREYSKKFVEDAIEYYNENK